MIKKVTPRQIAPFLILAAVAIAALFIPAASAFEDKEGVYNGADIAWIIVATALVFLNSEKLGEQYENDIFVGSAKKGTLFHFDLNSDRESLDLTGDLTDLLYSKKEDSSSIVFGENFGVITDLKVGPDGYLYVVSASRGTDEGAIYKIIPKSD